MGKYNLDSRMKEVVNDERVKEIIESRFPGAYKEVGFKIALRINPSIKQALTMTNKIPMSKDELDKVLNEILALD